MSNKNTISWQAPEFKHYEKNAGWYITLISIAVLILGFFVIVQRISLEVIIPTSFLPSVTNKLWNYCTSGTRFKG